jgi:N-acetylglucosaminyldiphosphoundecaprenol N-acetyl-beta-D-mannosaminyltransferase
MAEKKIDLFGLRVSMMDLEETGRWIINNKKGAKIYCCTLNEMMMAAENKRFKKMLSGGTILTADGMPLVWEMRRKTGKGERVYGPDLMRKIQNYKAKQIFIGDEKNKKYFEKLGEYIVLPYKKRFEKVDYLIMAEKIKQSRAKIIWIGLGGEKQVEVADNLAKKIPEKIYITVGAAFDFLSGNKKQAPKWMQKSGLEWLYRLANEPKRLGKRYWKCGLFLGKYYGRASIDFWRSGLPGFKKF